MQVRHEPLLLGHGSLEMIVGFGRIDRGKAQPPQVLDRLENAAHEPAKRRPARQVASPGGDVHAGEHDFGIATGDKPPYLFDHLAGGSRTRVATAKRNYAEGAAVIAAILDLNEGTGALGEAVEHVKRRLAHRHDVVHLHPLFVVKSESG